MHKTAAEQFVGRQWFDTHEWYEEPELHYWNRDKAGTTAEVDFLFQIRWENCASGGQSWNYG